jgi:ubiquinone/menaquinone biosynthesis C-methylase UbiE
MSDLGFRTMALTFKIRDLLRPRRDVVKEARIREGFHVLDYGCGSGSYVEAVVGLTGKSGKLYALDNNPTAIRMVKQMALKKNFTNVETILTDCETGLPAESIDVVLLYDVFHDLADPQGVLQELWRVLKTDGILSFSDHHLEMEETVSSLTKNGLFELAEKGEKTYSFLKKKRSASAAETSFARNSSKKASISTDLG